MVEHSLAEDDVIRQLIRWAEERESVRAAILTSTRTSPHAHTDVFSDYDIIYVVTDPHPFFEDRTWLEDFGRVLVVYRDPYSPKYGLDTFAYITQYENGLKIDFSFWPVEILPRVAADPVLPPVLDVGYTVLLDKDGLTAGLTPPTYRAYIPTPPTEEEFLTLVETFFHEATYAAKNLWRGELLPVKYFLDQAMKQDNLRKMLEWRVEIDHGWSLRTGIFGKGLKKRLNADVWAALEATYVGPGEEENWDALFRTIDLFRDVAADVAHHLGFAYPYGLDRRVVAYLQQVKALDRGAQTFA